MEDSYKMKVLVIGNSGVGKTTLINSIAGIETKEEYTEKINVYESSNWPIRFIDTKGFEYSMFEQWKSIHQIKRHTKIKRKDENSGIDAVWYCVEGTSRRTNDYNVKLMNKAVSKWNNVPVFVVITKSYSDSEIDKNIKDIKELFANNKKINLKGVIPVVAREYDINGEVIIPPRGIEELCLATLDCLDEARRINKENRLKLILTQKRFTAQGVIISATGLGVGIAYTDKTNVVDSILLTPIETKMVELIFHIYGVKYSKELVSKTVGGSAITNIAKYIHGKFNKSQIVDATIAGTIIFALGEAVVAASEAAYKGVINLDKIGEYMNNVIAKSTVVKKAMGFLEKNTNIDLDSNEVFKALRDTFMSNEKSA